MGASRLQGLQQNMEKIINMRLAPQQHGPFEPFWTIIFMISNRVWVNHGDLTVKHLHG
jgi:hypothetical protein